MSLVLKQPINVNWSRLFDNLTRAKRVQLQEISALCGLSKSGTRTQLVKELLQYGQKIDKDPIESVFSIDLGFKNFAFCKMNMEYEIEEWKRIDIDLPIAYDPIKYAELLYNFVQASLLPNAGRRTIFLIERQRHRTMGRAALPETVLKVNFIEIQLHCFLLGRSRSILPAQVSQYFELPSGHQKKHASIDVATKLLSSDSIVKISKLHAQAFEAEKKKDDMSDALLQAKAFIDWRHNFYKIAKEMAVDESIK